MESMGIAYESPRLRAASMLRDHVQWNASLNAEAKRSGQPVSWCTALSPNELLRAMGLHPVFPEAHAASCGVKKAGGPACEAAEAAGFSTDLCSYIKVDLATMLTGESPIGQAPVDPDLLFCNNNQCSTVTKWFQVNAEYYGVPLFVLDTPFAPDREHDTSVLDYIKAQFGELIAMVESKFGLRFDEARLRDVLRLSRRAVQLWQEILDLCRFRPAPVNTFDMWLHMTPMTLSRGTQECVDYYEALKAEIEERVRDGVAAVPGERIRLLWDDIGMWQRMKELSQKFGSYGGCFVSATYSDIWLFDGLDPERPFDGLARASLGTIINRSLDFRADYITHRIKKYAVDAVVIHSCRSCKPWFIGSYDLKDMIAERTGVPTLIVDGDMVDPRFISDDQLNSRIDAFMETLIK